MRHIQQNIIPKVVLEKAIEGGFKNPVPGDGQKVFLGPLRPYGVATALKMWECIIALDPTFWQALGKALGWDRNWRDPLKDWDTVAGKFYQEVLHGHDIDEFWTELLEAKQ